MTKFLYSDSQGRAFKLGNSYIAFRDPSMSISPTSYEFDKQGEAKAFYMTSNVSWDVSANPAWIDISAKTGQNGNGYFYGYAYLNDTGSYRSGYITMKCTVVPNVYPAGIQAFVEQYPGRQLAVQYDGDDFYYTEWNSSYGYSCYPVQYSSSLSLDIIATSGESWYCQFDPTGTFSSSKYSGTGNDTISVGFANINSYSGYLSFYWTDDDSYITDIYFYAEDNYC
jgi:hypothetical protein